MATNRENFHSWFVKVLKSLYPCEGAGFVILMTVFPLLERYLRQGAGIPAETDFRLNEKFRDELCNIFPKLRDRVQAGNFWRIYRNGLLHRVTFSQRAHPVIGLASHEESEAVSIVPNGFCIHPVLFAKRVLEVMGNNFSMFEGASSAAPPLSAVGLDEMRTGHIVTGALLPSIGFSPSPRATTAPPARQDSAPSKPSQYS
jgi:hypothetical protein